MQATIVYPREVSFNFNVPCFSSKDSSAQMTSDFLSLVEAAFCQFGARVASEMGVREIRCHDLLILHFDIPKYVVRENFAYREISREEFLQAQLRKPRPARRR
jgi:hypothetical protein